MSSNSFPLVAIIDADAAWRRVLVPFLHRRSLRVQVFAGAKEFWNDRPAADCLVIDLQIDHGTGDELHAGLKEAGENTSVILTTRPTAISKIVAAMHRGALTVLEKPCDPAALHGNIRQGLEQTAALRQSIREREQLAAKIRLLTPREHQVLELLLAGMHVKQIGHTLGIGSKTVHTFRSHLMRKLESDSQIDLIRQVALVFGREGINRCGVSTDERTLNDLLAPF